MILNLADYIPFIESLKQWQITLFYMSVMLAFACLISLSAKKLISFFIVKDEKYGRRTAQGVVKAIHLPFQFIIWSYTSLQLIHLFWVDLLDKDSLSYEGEITGLLFCVMFGWIVGRVLEALEPNFIKKAMKSGHSPRQSTANVRAVSKISKIATWLILSLIIMGIFNVPLSGLLTFGGVGGIGVALASKDLLANFAGSVMVFFNRHFSVGDWIYSPDRELQGTVESIGWRLTRIRSFDQRPVYVPNAVFNNVIIVNASKMNNRRINQTIGLRYDDAEKVEGILADIRNMLKKHDGIDQNNTILVNLSDQEAFGPYQINFIIYAFTKTNDWEAFKKVQDNVLLKSFSIIKSHDAEIAFPTRSIINSSTQNKEPQFA